VLKQLTATLPNVKVLVFSGRGSPGNIRELLAAGAQSYVDKMDGFAEFKKALEIIAAGGTFIGPRMATAMRSLIRDPDSARAAHPLSNREKQILQLVAEGFSTREIAGRLGLSVRTVDNHRTNIMRKLNLHNVAALTRYAIQNELVSTLA
jgi:DNA-binding NarL/FixJ family response regulator